MTVRRKLIVLCLMFEFVLALLGVAIRCTPLSRQKIDLLKVLSLPGVFVLTSEKERPVGPVGNVGKSRCFLRDFSKSLWESALFADFHRDGIFHRPYALAFEIRESIFSVSALAA